MRALLRPFNIFSWPIALKLGFGIGLAILLPVGLLLSVGLSSVAQINRQNVESYIREVGTRQQQAITSALNQASTLNASLAVNPILLTGLADEPPNTRALSDILQNNLLSGSSNLFSNVWLLNPGGRVIGVASETTTTGTAVLLREDRSNSEAFRVGRNLAQQGKTQDIVVYTRRSDSSTVIEIVTVVFDEGEARSYLVSSLNVNQVVLNNLRLQDNVLKALSFVVGRDGSIVASDRADSLTFQSIAARRALSGVFGIQQYRISAQEYLGYYAPVLLQGQSNPVFGLVTQVDAGVSVTQISEYIAQISFPLVAGGLTLLGILVLLFQQLFVPPLMQFVNALRAMTRGNFSEPIPAVSRGDEFGTVATALVDMRQQVRDLINDLASQVTERVRDVETTQEISRFAITQRDLQVLMNKVVDLIVERFSNIYHAQIFLLDDDREYAVLRASTGTAGQQLLARGHKLAVGSVSVIGQVTQEGRVIVARDIASSEVHRRNEFLPETRAELAIPLSIGQTIIGALDVQSKLSGSFKEDEIKVLETMAAQIAIAIENARLYEESIHRLEEIKTSNQKATLRAWEEYMAAERQTAMLSTSGTETGTLKGVLHQRAVAEGKIVVGDMTDKQTVPVAIPIQLRGQILGAVEWELPAADFTSDKVLLAQELVNRLAVSLDNARLFQESQRAIQRERLVNKIATRLTQQTDINEILQTAVREVGQALRSPRVSIQLHRSDTSESTNGHHEE